MSRPLKKAVSSQVNISTLKAELSRYLRLVKDGKEITIMDRNLAVAKISPVNSENMPSLKVIPPLDSDTSFEAFKGKKLLKKKTDIVASLLEDREEK